MTHHSLIPKEVHELLSKGTVEPSTGGTGFYSSIFVVPLCTGSLQPILNPRQFNCYMHIPTFKILLSDRNGNLFNKVIKLFLLISRMLIYIFLLLSITVTCYILFDNTNLISGRFCHLSWLQMLGFSLHLANKCCSFGDAMIFVLLLIWIKSSS